ncbi:MAG TPA: DUF5060 domain-containing protein [Tepidisphaeraceae bacterium]
MKRNWPLLCIILLISTFARADVEQWGIYDLALNGPAEGNPFIDVNLSARFTCENQTIEAHGFYDGDGTYRVRFMPDRQGVWKYETQSNRPELAGKTGEFTCVKPSAGNHGPVRVHNVHHFAYADGTPYKPVGTTAYGWVHQPDALEEQTLATLKSSAAFNKIRMCILPTRYRPGIDEPIFLPFHRAVDGRQFDLKQFDVRFFQHMEKRIAQLGELGVEADLILFHPYGEGRLGFDRMDADTDDRYLRYVVARFSAYRNVWWSLANEFDLLRQKKDSDWDRFFQIVQTEDPYQHLRSIHFSRRMYDPSKPWVTHVSVQNGEAVADFGRAVLYRQICPKPIVYDEVCYEGKLDARWGQLSGEQMLMRFWFGAISGTYVGHGEALLNGQSRSWLGNGGTFIGESPKRIAFLKQILDTAPADGIEPIDQYFQTHLGGKPGQYYLLYFGTEKPTEWTFQLPGKDPIADGASFHVDVLDTWNMTITPVDQVFKVKRKSPYAFTADPEAKIRLPGSPYMALRIRRN